MATIYFNGKSFEIPEAALSVASGALRNHLSSVMNGTGATINFDGTAYNIDSAKLSTATNEFITHLGTVAGSGYKVMVGGTEYGIDSAKMSGAVAEIEAVLGGLHSGNEELAAGLYKNGVMTKSWDELVDEGIITVEGSTITGCADKTISGDLIAPNSITSIEKQAFQICAALTSVDLPVAESIGSHAFYNCTSLTSVDLPAATSIEKQAFLNCAALTSVDLPVATSIGSGAFQNCLALTSVGIPVATSIGIDAFQICTALTSVDLPAATSIEEYAFQSCTNLSTVILRNPETVCQIIVTAVLGTKIVTAEGAPTGEGFIYVPSALYEGYVELIAMQAEQMIGDAATAEYIARAVLRKIEDYPEICNPAPTPTQEILEGDGQEFHKFAPTALTFRSTAPLNELQEVQINGVTVDPSNYTLEEGSTIVTLPIEYLKTLDVDNYEITVVSDSKSAKGRFSVVQPELNEHDFYYNQPYTAFVPYYGEKVAFIFREDGSGDFLLVSSGYTEIVSFTSSANAIVLNGVAGTFNATVSSDGTEVYCVELDTTFKLGDESIVADEDYIYTYREDWGGYEVSVIDKAKAEYPPIRIGVNGASDLVGIDEYAFSYCENLTSICIPEGVTHIGHNAFNGNSSITSINIPDSVIFIGVAFLGCTSLTNINIPVGVTYLDTGIFDGCSSLTKIVFNGTIAQWNAMSKAGNWNQNCSATYVQCSDGQVAI